MDCPTHFQKFGSIRLSNFREQFPAATKTRRTLTFRRFIRCFLRVCTMATWSSRADRSTQSWPTRALVCSYRKGYRSLSIASFYGAKSDRWTLFSSRYVPADRTDIAVALRGCNAGLEHNMACGPTYHRAIVGSLL